MSLYHQIFVKSSFNENSLDNLKRYMLDDDFLNSIKQEEKKEEVIEVQEPQTSTIMDRNDPLFWLMYISIYGAKEYEVMQNGFDNVMMNKNKK